MIDCFTCWLVVQCAVNQQELFFTTASACWCTLVYLVPSRFVTPLEVCPRRHRTSEPTHWITISICNLLLKSSDEEMTSISQMETSQSRWRQFGPQTALPLGTRAYPSTICFCVTSVLASGSRWLQRWVRSFVPAVALSVSWLALGAKLHAFTCIDGHTEFHNDFLVPNLVTVVSRVSSASITSEDEFLERHCQSRMDETGLVHPDAGLGITQLRQARLPVQRARKSSPSIS